MAKNDERFAEKINVLYSDGSTEELKKGLVFRFREDESDEETARIDAELVGMSGRDLYTVVGAAVELGVKLGMFNGTGGADNEES